jgi:hypothetical protein
MTNDNKEPQSKNNSIKDKINHIIWTLFKRDMTINREDILDLMLQAIVFIIQMVFMVYFLSGDIDNVGIYTFNQALIVYIVAGVILFFGGIFIAETGNLASFEKLTFISVFCMVLISLVPIEAIYLIAGVVQAGIAVILGLSFFIALVSKTTILNRARIVIFLVLSTTTISITIIIIVNSTHSQNWLWIISLMFGFLLHYRNRNKNFQKPLQKRKKTPFSFRTYFKVIRESRLVPYCYFLFLTASVLGFYLSLLVGDDIISQEILSIVLIGLFTFPIISALLDYFGRKPLLLFSMAAVGLISIFFDYPISPNMSESVRLVQLIVFGYSFMLIALLSIIIAGDISSVFSRGQVLGLFISAAVGGYYTGNQLYLIYLHVNTFEQYPITEISDWASALLFISIIFLSKTQNIFQKKTPEWRQYLDRLYLITKAGIALYSTDLKPTSENSKERENLNEDLISGGLSGVQMMIKEIAQSQENIQILDHGDIKFYFHHGEYSVAVLIVKKDLLVFREKLERFHNKFESTNGEILKHFQGDIKSLHDLKELSNHYFS